MGWAGRTTFALLVALAASLAGGLPGADAATPECAPTSHSERQLELTCAPGFATARDRVTLYFRQPVDPRLFWAEALDFENAVWLFDAGLQGRASLIIDFRREGSALVAELFDDGDGDGAVAYELVAGLPQVTESGGRWSVQVRAPDGFWVRDGRVNYTLDLLADGPIKGMIDIPEFDYERLMPRDGVPDLEVHVRDRDGDGRPDYEWRQSYLPLPDTSGYFRSAVMVNERDDEPAVRDYAFWPHLGDGLLDLIKPYATSFPAVQVDWGRGRIPAIAEFVASRDPNNWFVYSINRIQEGELTASNFENPFMFYDLASRDDGLPDGALRFEYFPAGDIFRDPGRPFPEPVAQVDWSWDADHDGVWDYKLDLLGFHAIEEVVRFPEFAIRSLPFDGALGWVAEREWSAATFVEAVAPYPASNEGIYEWSTNQGGLRDDYLTGRTTEPPAEAFADISEGMRGEYAFVYGRRPLVYLSPVDGRLHLLGAEGGVWDIGGGRRLRYENHDGDDYVEGWVLEGEGRPISRLTVLPGLAVVQERTRVVFVAGSPGPVPFIGTPPTDRRQWQKLAGLLEGRVRPDPEPAALAATLPGERYVLPLSTLRSLDYRAGAWRLELELTEAAPVGLTGLLGLPPGAVGAYVVRLSEAGAEAAPLTAAAVIVTPPAPVGRAPVEAGQVSTLRVAITNGGLADGEGLTLRVVATSPEGERSLVDEVGVVVPGGGASTVDVRWIPPGPGAWVVTAELAAGPDFRGALETAHAARGLEVGGAALSSRHVLELVELTPNAVVLVVALFAAGLTVAALFSVAAAWGRAR